MVCKIGLVFLLFWTIHLSVAGSGVDTLSFSFSDGSQVVLKLENAGLISPTLQARFPNLKSWRAVSGHPLGAEIRALQWDDRWEVFLMQGDAITFFVRKGSDTWEVQWQEVWGERRICLYDLSPSSQPREKKGLSFPDDTLRTYRLALAVTGEFADYYGGQSDAVFAAMVRMMSLVNAVFERDLGVRFRLIDRTEDLIFLTAQADPYTMGNEASENQSLLDRVIGDAGYDIGHLLGGLRTTSIGRIGGICRKGEKGIGVSTSLVPEGLPFILDYLCHELGHQLGARHTFNSLQCDAQRSPATAWEPGSGVSIMGYPGLCGKDNLATHAIPRFHSGSIEEIGSLLSSAERRTCGEKSDRGLAQLPALAMADAYLPQGTPFLLDAGLPSGGIWYAWESMDRGAAQWRDSLSGSSPNLPITQLIPSPSRSFPRMDSLWRGTSEPGLILAQYSRPLNLRLTQRTRDRVRWDPIALQVLEGVGPFRVRAPATSGKLAPQAAVEVEWVPANTFMPPMAAERVDLFLVDSRQPDSFRYVQRQVPNLGRFAFLLPENLPPSQYKVGVKGSGKPFFQLSPGVLSLSGLDTFPFPEIRLSAFSCQQQASWEWDFSQLPDTLFPLRLTVREQFGWDLSWKDRVITGPGKISLMVRKLNLPAESFGRSMLTLNHGQRRWELPLTWHTAGEVSTDIQPVFPAMGAGIAATLPRFTWKADRQPDWYVLEIARDAGFRELWDVVTCRQPEAMLNRPLLPGLTYYWRVKYGFTSCSAGSSSAFTFSVAPETCLSHQRKDTLVLNAIPFRQSSLTVSESGAITGLRLAQLSLKGSDWGRVSFYLRAPSGSRIPLKWPESCALDSSWNHVVFQLSGSAANPCLRKDTLTISGYAALESFRGENLKGVWQLQLEGANQRGALGDWGFNACYQVPTSIMPAKEQLGHLATVVFPNPSGDASCTLQFPDASDREIILWDMLGRRIRSWWKATGETEVLLETPGLTAGLYIWDIRRNGGQREILRWVVK